MPLARPSERQDSNLRPPAPEAGALTRLRYVPLCGDEAHRKARAGVENRTRVRCLRDSSSSIELHRRCRRPIHLPREPGNGYLRAEPSPDGNRRRNSPRTRTRPLTGARFEAEEDSNRPRRPVAGDRRIELRSAEFGAPPGPSPSPLVWRGRVELPPWAYETRALPPELPPGGGRPDFHRFLRVHGPAL